MESYQQMIVNFKKKYKKSALQISNANVKYDTI